MPDKRKVRGATTREAILSAAVDLASVEGLEGLTIGCLSQKVGMSKSGLFAHFGSKQELQLAAIDHARVIFLKKVVTPSEAQPEGLPRLYAMESSWIDYLQDTTFPGGCFFSAASAEFDGRPGPIRERIASLTKHWRELLETEAARAIALGHIDQKADPALLAFQLHALLQEANWAHQLLGDEMALRHARAAAQELLRSIATPEGIRKAKQRKVVAARAVAT